MQWKFGKFLRYGKIVFFVDAEIKLNSFIYGYSQLSPT